MIKHKINLYKYFNIFYSKREKFLYFSIIFLSIFAIFLDLIGLSTIPVFIGLLIGDENVLNLIKKYDYLSFILNPDNYVINALLIILIFFFKFILQLTLLFFNERLDYYVTTLNSSKLFSKYLFLPYINFISLNPSILLRNIISEIGNVSKFFNEIIRLIKEFALIFLIIFILFFATYSLANFKYFFFLFFFIIFFYLFFKKNILSRSKENQILMGQILRSLDSVFRINKEIRISLKQTFFLNYFSKKNIYFFKNNSYLNFYNKSIRVVLEFFFIVVCLLLFITLSLEKKSGQEILVYLTIFVFAGARLLPSLGSIVASLSNLDKYKISLSLLFEELNKKYINLQYKKKNYNFFGPLINNIEFRNVKFSFNNSNGFIFNRFNLNLKKNTLYGVIGKSGSGKTTFLNVLSGLLRPSVGSVKVNGKNILYRENMWHTHISYVSQEIFLMDDSILSNIAFGINNENIDNKKINEIIELCELGPLIKSLPNGLKSNIGYNGAKLSGGQKQRVAIARALYQNKNVLILDEATNALDENLENKILDRIKLYYKNKVVILVSHRLSAIRKCEKIIILKTNSVPKKIKNLNNSKSINYFKSIGAYN